MQGAEADDIIAVLAKNIDEKMMIVSGDKDFIQLHKYKQVRPSSPILKKIVNRKDPIDYIKVNILKGDSSDGIPNVLSNDNVFVEGLRQRPLSKKKIAEWAGPLCEQFLPSDEAKRNYQRNKKLIDLKESPDELYLECIKA